MAPCEKCAAYIAQLEDKLSEQRTLLLAMSMVGTELTCGVGTGENFMELVAERIEELAKAGAAARDVRLP